MLPRLWLLVGSDPPTDRQTMSLIELSWTAKKELSLEPAQVKSLKNASTMNGTGALSACIQGRRRVALDQHGFASLTTLFVRFMQIFVCLFVNLVVCPKQVREENALWARESRSRFAICASTPTRKLSNGDRLNCFFLLQFLVFRKHSNHQHKGVFLTVPPKFQC